MAEIRYLYILQGAGILNAVLLCLAQLSIKVVMYETRIFFHTCERT